MIKKTQLSDAITPYIYGTTRLGDDSIPVEKRIEIANTAMEAGVWFHTSHHYNTALKILHEAFANNPGAIPKLIVKLGGSTIAEFRKDIQKNLQPLGVDHIDVGQLCLGGGLAEEFATGGKCYDEFRKILDEGVVNNFVMEVFPWTSQVPLQALQKGYSDELVSAHIFYLNPLQRFAGNALWDELRIRKAPVIAMRTVSGGPVHRLRDVPGFAWKEYLQQRAVEVAPIFEESGVENWTEFCVRYAHSLPNVISTVGATSRIENLKEFLRAKDNLQPLPESIMSKISALHYRWSDELDVKAEPWTM